MRGKKHFILILTLTAFRLFAQPALPTTNQTFAPIANAYSGSWIFYTTNAASGLGFLNGASISYVTTVSNNVIAYVNAATNSVGANDLAQLNSASNVLSAKIVAATNGLGGAAFLSASAFDPAGAAAAVTNTPAIVRSNQVLVTTNVITSFASANNLGSVAFSTNSAGVTATLTISSQTNGFGSIVTHSASELTSSVIWSGVSGNTLAAGSTFYAMPDNSTSMTATGQTNGVTSVPATESLTLTNLYVVTSGAVGSGSSHTSTLTIMTNGVATPIAVSITGTSLTTGNDTNHSVTVSAGTTIGVRITTGSSATAVYWSWSFEGW